MLLTNGSEGVLNSGAENPATGPWTNETAGVNGRGAYMRVVDPLEDDRVSMPPVLGTWFWLRAMSVSIVAPKLPVRDADFLKPEILRARLVP
jgi:hypothetical protein